MRFEVQQRQRVGLGCPEGAEVVGIVEDPHSLEHVEQVEADDRGLGHAERSGEQRDRPAERLEQLVEDDRDGDVGDEHDDVGSQARPEEHGRVDDVLGRGARITGLDELGADADLGEQAAGDDGHVEHAGGSSGREAPVWSWIGARSGGAAGVGLAGHELVSLVMGRVAGLVFWLGTARWPTQIAVRTRPAPSSWAGVRV